MPRSICTLCLMFVNLKVCQKYKLSIRIYACIDYLTHVLIPEHHRLGLKCELLQR